MIYIWRIPEKYPQKLIGLYDEKNSPNRFNFRKGHKISEKQGTIFIKFSCNISDIKRFDNLPNSSQLPLVNERLSKLLDEITEFDVQYFDSIIECKDGTLDKYKIVNVTHTIKAIDHKRSEYDLIEDSNVILGFKFLAFIPSSMGNHIIARDDEYKSHILANEKLYQVFQENNIRGVELITSNEFNKIKNQ